MNSLPRSSRLLLPQLTVAAALFLLSFHLPAQSDLTGFWVFRMPTGDGNFRQSFFELKQDGDAVTGKAIFGSRERPFTEGSFRDGKLRFVVSFTFGNPPRTRTTIYEGTPEGDHFALTSQTTGRDPVKGTLERSRPEAALPPPRLPLPELRDLPDNGLARTPPMGWNSWNLFACRGVNDQLIREIADAMVASGMKDAGYQYVNIDDCWMGPRDAQGNLTSNLKFPDMKALADYVHSKGLKIGVYTSPGPTTCQGYPATYGHEEQDARTFAAWGMDYLKYDWCSAGRIYKDEEMRAVYQKMGDALRATGRPIVYSLCQYGRSEVWTWGAKVGGNLWRTTGDIRDTWESMDRIGFRTLELAPYQQPGHWNDPDMLEIGNGGMTADEYRTHFSLWTMLAAPLLAGNDLRNMSEETKSILLNREVIAIDQDPAGKPVQRIPVGTGSQPARSTASSGATQRAGAGSAPDATAVVLARPLHDGSFAIGLFNRADQPQSITVKWSDVPWADAVGAASQPERSSSGKVTASTAARNAVPKNLRARDLWKHADVPITGDSYSATVPAHAVVLLKVTPQ